MRKFQVTVNGNTYEVDVEEITAGAVSNPVSAPKKLDTVSSPIVTPSVGTTKVEAPMQGKIVDIKVSVGATVAAGEVVAILEAMKMENEVVAPAAGKVASINVSAGQAVNAGDMIISLN